jgi:hypothetical protein
MELARLTAAQRSRMHTGGRTTEAEYRLAWARTALKGMRALENVGRGIWRVTPLGRDMPPHEIDLRLDMYLAELASARRDRPSNRRPRSQSVGIVSVEPPSPAESAALAARTVLLDDLPPRAVVFEGPLPTAAERLETNFATGGVSLVSAVFQNTFFAHPSMVRSRTPYFPAFARTSRKHYGRLVTGQEAVWQGTAVRLDDNSRAQMAWQKYTGRALSRGSGFGLRHIWGHPWDPAAFTAGWNLAYMPHWAGMLTEDQHAHAVIQQAVRQASWELFFQTNPVCEPPAFVGDPRVDLGALIGDQRLNVLAPGRTAGEPGRDFEGAPPEAIVRSLRARTTSLGRTSPRRSLRCRASPTSPSAAQTSKHPPRAQ